MDVILQKGIKVKKLVCLCALAAGLAATGAVEIRSDYPGGNVKVEKIDEVAGVVTLAPDLRDTKTKWFHFDFTLTGAAGRKLHFQFPAGRFNYLATLGPAISRDGGATWRWLNSDGTRHEPGNAFDYTFGHLQKTALQFSIAPLQTIT